MKGVMYRYFGGVKIYKRGYVLYPQRSAAEAVARKLRRAGRPTRVVRESKGYQLWVRDR